MKYSTSIIPCLSPLLTALSQTDIGLVEHGLLLTNPCWLLLAPALSSRC